jgi:1-acyl-sn-glycerol-3-phosphate acyltransferase
MSNIITPSKGSSLPPPDRRADGFTALYRPVRLLFTLYFRLGCGLEVTGVENIPAKGPVIIATNHVSMADPPLLASSMPRPLRYMAKQELFKHPFFASIITQLGAFPIERGAPDRAAIRKALSIVENGEVLVIFPEGSRGDGITLGAPEKGVSLIAQKSGAPIVPGYIDGTHLLLQKGSSKVKKTRLKVHFGKPIDSTAFTGKTGLETLGPAIMLEIARLRDEHR